MTRKAVIAATLVGASFLPLAHADTVKAGLWEMTITKQVHDGRDMTATMAAAQERMRAAMASMSPEQRKMMESMVGSKGAANPGGGSATRICISPAMAARNEPMADPQGRCPPANISRSGNTMSFEFSCTREGVTTTGKGTNTITGDTANTHLDMTSTDARGTHTTQMETTMKYLGSDCQGVTPLDELVKGAQAK